MSALASLLLPGRAQPGASGIGHVTCTRLRAGGGKPLRRPEQDGCTPSGIPLSPSAHNACMSGGLPHTNMINPPMG